MPSRVCRRDAHTVAKPASGRGWWFVSFACTSLALVLAMGAQAASLSPLTDEQRAELESQFATLLEKRKGPFGPNVCVCEDGRKEPLRRANGSIQNACGAKTLFCSAFRGAWAEAMGEQGVWVGNLFANDLHEWDRFSDHHNLVRGYVLESFFIGLHPEHRLATARSLRGVAGAEYEAPAVPLFVERYLSLDSFQDPRHFLLAYELQRRFFVNDDQGEITTIRNLATQIESMDAKFKPLRDAVHNQISASLVPRLSAYREKLPNDKARARLDTLIAQIEALTALDESVLVPQLAALEDAALRAEMEALMPSQDAAPKQAIEALAEMMVRARRKVSDDAVAAADRRRLIEINVTAAAVLQALGSALLESNDLRTVKQHLEILINLTDAAYGAGLITERERKAATEALAAALQQPKLTAAEFGLVLERAGRTVGWAQEGIDSAFDEIAGGWVLILPEVAMISDDVLRGSPLSLYGEALSRLEDHALAQARVRHEVMGQEYTRDVRALNPGLAKGTLHVDPNNEHASNEVVALPQTPSELQPAAGITTRGEGNVLSHVQLLARALGIPNVVTGPEPYDRIAAQDGKDVFYVVTPGGRVYLKEASQMTPEDEAVFAEYNFNTKVADDGSFETAAQTLDIDPERLDLSASSPLDLASVGLGDSGVRCGPKAAYLGELKSLFPENVSRGVVLPFGVYYGHYQAAKVVLPESLADAGIAEAGEPLSAFVERTYQTLFDEMIPSGASESELKKWSDPRLAVIRESITGNPLNSELREAIRATLAEQGLLRPEDPAQTVGLFVRSDTNVEDLDNFSGAGLNLTLFNLGSLEDVFAGIKEVWASPFTMRSFSWRQPYVNEPLWVLPSIVILESVPSQKSGVLVTADIFHDDPSKMVVATSEGVGGAVDGTPAETLLWSPESVELVNSYRSAWRLMLKEDGGSEVVPSTGREYVLEEQELETLISAAQTINKKIKPTLDGDGEPRPWDIEFGFVDGELWLFQTRPFIGNEELRNLPALAAFETTGAEPLPDVSLDDVIQ